LLEEPTDLSSGIAEVVTVIQKESVEASNSAVPIRAPDRAPLLRRLLAGADAIAVMAACLVVSAFTHPSWGDALVVLCMLPLWIVLAKLYGLYDRDQRSLRHLTLDEVPYLIAWAVTGSSLLGLLLIALPCRELPAGALIATWALVFAFALVLRASVRVFWRARVPRERTLVVGSGPLARSATRKLELYPELHVTVVATRPELTLDELAVPPSWLQEVDRILLAETSVDEHLISQLIAFCRERRIRLSVVPPARGIFGTAVQLNHIADLPLVEYNTWDVSRSTLLVKRAVDLAVCVPALLLLSPLFALIAVAIKLDDGGPVLFSQSRASQYGRPFRMLKFRTMVVGAENLLDELMPLGKHENDPRVTRVGRLLRRASLDELPQLVNVVRGDMTLVGPRPEQVEIVERYEADHLIRLAVKPGMTGPMQVYGRGALTADERLALEREYVENMTFRRDVRILALTISAVVGGHGAY
jgi:exopolysaccharide biosynthesis polyprenyl glycosylphosphotransferase